MNIDMLGFIACSFELRMVKDKFKPKFGARFSWLVHLS